MNFRNTFRRNKKTEISQVFVCSLCGESHEEWPAITFDSPDSYYILSGEVKNSIGFLDADFCVVKHEDQTDRFIRVTMTQNVTDCDQDLQYGLWVSLSEESYEGYKANFNNAKYEEGYFGWLNNDLPEYEIGEPIPTNLRINFGKIRPEIFPHQTCGHQMVNDYYRGITKSEALGRIERMKK